MKAACVRPLALRMASVLAAAILLGAGVAVARLPGAEETLGSYGTSLRGRTRSQAFNARRAAQALDGVSVRPGETFSFNTRVGPWNAASGYRKAPASYDGELVRSYGGGVCQTSTTLYNAALTAGLEIAERHRHIRPPTYVTPGRDAAVAMPDIDLRLRNPYHRPIRLEARVVGDSLLIAVKGHGPRRPATVHTEVQAVAVPPLVRGAGTATRGQPGFTTLTYRAAGGKGRAVAHDRYPPVARLRAGE